MDNLNNNEFEFLNDESNEQEQEQNNEQKQELFYKGAGAFLNLFYSLTCVSCSLIEALAVVSLGNNIAKTTKKRKKKRGLF